AAGLRRDVLLLRAKAHAERGSPLLAEKALEEALAIDPRSARVKAAQGALMLRQGRLEPAARLSEEALALGGDEPAAWELKASLLHVRGDSAAALAAYEHLLQLNPRHVEARIARAGLLVDRGRLDEAAADVTEILRIFPRDPRGGYLQALIAARRGDVATAKEALKAVVNLLDPVPPDVLGANRQMLMLLSLAHFSLGNQEKAAVQLREYLRRYPGDVGASKVLASIHLQRGEAGKAISLLEPLRTRQAPDATVLSLLAAAYMSERRYAQASRLLDEAVRLSGGAAGFRADLGLSLLGEGRSDLGLEQLQQAFARDPKQTPAGIALAALLMRRGQPAKALEVAEAMARSNPGNVAVLNLLGGLKSAAGDLTGARQAYEQVLASAPGHAPATLNLARVDLAERRTEAARSRLLTLLKASPNNTDAMIELSETEVQAGNVAEAVKWLEKARAYPAAASRASLQLAELHLAQRSLEQALAVARDAVLKSDRSLPALALLARVQTAGGNFAEARKTLGEMTRIANFDAESQLAIARLQRAADNDPGAMYSLEKALGGKPDYLPVQLMMIEIDIAQKNFAQAEGRLKPLLRQHPGEIAVARLQGDLLLARGQFPAAIAAYRALLGKKGGEGVVLALYRAYEQAGERGQGLKALEEWSRTRPGDATALRVLGDGYLAAGEPVQARRSYERLLVLRPDDALVLNNLALALLQQRDGQALTVAEKAYKLAGRDPLVADTLGWVLVNQGEVERGLGYLREARLRDPGNREIRYHLAFALARSGRQAEARQELTVALADGHLFEGIDGARTLQRELGR
ncbi:MAG TPA: XrtA/PEP-CTERM system TPR-repeat protein PrsT, partial [Azonexus sp.]